MRKIIRHASLFSGIGAPELAALWIGWQNVFHCEINEFCNTILNYWFPNSINYENINTTDFSKWQGQIDILTGGFPCQPFSSAGRRLGTDDDRYLWPEMLRVIRQIQPTFVIGENVAGILSMVQPSEEIKVGSSTSLFEENDDIYQKEQEFVVETVCSSLECEGYSVQPFVIPACAVGAPHQRDRVWFVAKRNVPAPDTFNTGVEGMQERQAEDPFSRSAPHTISGGDTTQQAYQGSEEEGRNDDGQQSQRRATPQWSYGLHQLSRHTTYPEYGRCDNGSCHRQERQNSTDTLRNSAQSNPNNKFQPRSCKDGSISANTLCSGFQEEGIELQTEGVTRNIPQMGLATDSQSERRDESYDDNGEPQVTPQEERCTEQPVGADCPQNWWRDFPTIPPVCRGNDGLPFDISRLTIPFSRWRQESIKALGNSMVPQVVFELFKAIDMEIFEE